MAIKMKPALPRRTGRLNRALKRLVHFVSNDRAVSTVLGAVCLAAYVPGIRAMGFYWDDWPMNWIAQNLGPAGFVRYFSTNRPVYGLLYQVTTPIIGSNPLAWQLAAIVVRWLMVLAAWALVRKVWPERPSLALFTGLLFAVYPGFMDQHVALIYTHHFMVIIFLLTSLLCTVIALRNRRFFWPLTALGLVLSLANLLMMEYFFMLDLLRPLLIFIVLGQLETGLWRARLWQTIKIWALYLVIFIGAGIWRAFLYPYTQENYQLTFFSQLKTQPLQAILDLAGRALGEIWTSFGAAWLQVFHRPTSADAQAAGGMLRFGILMGVLAVALVVVLLIRRDGKSSVSTAGEPEDPVRRDARYCVSVAGQQKRVQGKDTSSGVSTVNESAGATGGDAISCVSTTGKKPIVSTFVVGAVALLLAGAPFYLTNVPFSLDFAYDRFTLPFMLGVSLVLAGIFEFLPIWRTVRVVLLVALVTLGAAWQVETASAYVRDWQVQNGFFEQLTWRVPGLPAGTTILANELPIHPTDNSLTAPLNWIYAPGDSGASLPYLLDWPTIRLGTEALPALAKGQPVRKNYLVSVFTGSTDQAIAVYYNPPACLRLLDVPDGNDSTLPQLSKQMAVLSNPALVDANGAAGLLPGIFAAPRPGTWCEYYEKADLARQQGDWSQIGQIATQAGDLLKQAQASTELFPFIEGYGHLGNWDEVIALSKAAAPAADSDLRTLVCAILGRLQTSTPVGPAKTAALAGLDQFLQCKLAPAP